MIADTTSSFNDISQRINRCVTALRDDLNRTDLAGMIRQIQDCERAKFEAVSIPLLGCADGGKTVKTQMWKMQEGERDFSEDIREANRQ